MTSTEIRIVFLLQDLAHGGTQRQCLALAARLNPALFKSELWLMTSAADLAPEAVKAGLPVIRLTQDARPGLHSITALRRRLAKEKVDVLVLMTVVPNIWGRILGRLSSVPVIIGTCRGSGSPRRQHERWLWPHCDHVISNAAALSAILTGKFKVPAARITTIVNGVDTEFFRPPSAPPPRPPAIILNLARLAPDKDQATLIRAFGLLAQTRHDVELRIVGDGPRGPALKKLIRREPCSDRIRLMPAQDDVRPPLRQAHLLALSSVNEGLPNVALEALACGVPVVATAVGGLPEVVTRQVGRLVPPRDPRALARAIRELLADESARQALGRSARAAAEKRWSMSAMVRAHEALFLRLLGVSGADTAYGLRRWPFNPNAATSRTDACIPLRP
jgi:glycosyltransferase involved in cell wall biosynthesis